jgi:FkbM family methyltransferase
MKFHVPNDRTLYRAESFLVKEPETINWIDGFESSSVFWDVGACVGTYSVYAAMSRTAKVVAVEPSVFNLEWLARNIYTNNLASRVVIVPIAITSNSQVSEFKMQVTEWGGALSSFGVTYNHEGDDFMPKFEYSTIGSTAAFLIDNFALPSPRYVKIDVDSIEHLVVKGLLPYLSGVESLALENSRNPEVVEQCKIILTNAGFNIQTVGRANSIWSRPDFTKLEV